MGFLSGLSTYITPATQALAGAQEGKVQGLLEKIKLDREAKSDAIKSALAGLQTRNIESEIKTRENPKETPVFSQDNDPYVMRGGKMVPVPVENPSASSHVDNSTAESPSGPVADNPSSAPPVQQGAQQGGQPVKAKTPKFGPRKEASTIPGTPEWKAAKILEARIGAEYGYHPDDKTLVPVQQADGSSIYTPRSQAAGQRVPGKGQGAGNLPAPLAAKVGQAGEMMKKAYDLLPRMDKLDVDVGNSAAQDVAAHGVGIGPVRIPGTQGVGSLMLNHSEPYATYQAALSPFILAAAHALSGARINQDQVEQIRHSIEYKPGDSPGVKAQKRKNMLDLVNSIAGSLPSDAIAAQEDQMEPNALTQLTSYGYRRAKRAGAPSVSSTGSTSTGDIDLSAKPKLNQAQYDAGRALHSDAEIATHYDLSGIKRKQ